MKRFIAAFLVLLLLFGGTPSVSANSAQTYWEGVDRAGVIITDGDCPIVVEHELLTFDLQEFPDYHRYAEDYPNKVTAQYTFHNPSDMAVTAKLFFPFGDKNWYYDPDNTLAEQYDILIDGEPVEKKIRHTLSYGSFSLEQDLALISYSYAEDAFFSPDTPVTIYKYSVSGVDTQTYKRATVSFEIPEGVGNYIYYLPDFNLASLQGDGDMRVASYITRSGSPSFLIYVFGEAPDVKPEFQFYQDCSTKENERIDGRADLRGVQKMTFQEFALDSWYEELGVSQIDWYNATIADLREGHKNTEYPVMFRNSYRMEDYLMQWYEYEITVGPGERIVNTVTAPIYPSINLNYTPDIYGYTYLLSPAKTWKSFGTLEIVVNTPYYITESSLDGFEKTEDGYKLTLPGLPDSELTFTLCSSENPEAPKTNFFYGFIYFFAMIFSYIGYLFESLFDAIGSIF